MPGSEPHSKVILENVLLAQRNAKCFRWYCLYYIPLLEHASAAKTNRAPFVLKPASYRMPPSTPQNKKNTRRHGVWAVHGLSTSGVFASGGGDAAVKVWAPKITQADTTGYTTKTRGDGAKIDTASAEIGGDGTKNDNASPGVGGDGIGVMGDKRGDERCGGSGRRWECVGGVRGAVGAVGAVLMTEEALLFGTSEALIARFPLQSCMPVRC